MVPLISLRFKLALPLLACATALVDASFLRRHSLVAATANRGQPFIAREVLLKAAVVEVATAAIVSQRRVVDRLVRDALYREIASLVVVDPLDC